MRRRPEPDHVHHSRPPRPRRRVRLLPLLLMIVGAATLLVLALRYAVVPLLVYLGGTP